MLRHVHCLVVTTVCVGALAAAQPAAAPPKKGQAALEGRIERVTPTELTLTSGGETVSVALDASTAYSGPGLRTASDLQPGRDVRVEWRAPARKRVATRIVGMGAGTTPKQGTTVPDQSVTPPSPRTAPPDVPPRRETPVPGPGTGTTTGSEVPNPRSPTPDMPAPTTPPSSGVH
jgi:hypothetical protein